MNRIFLHPSREPIQTHLKRHTIRNTAGSLEIWRSAYTPVPRAFVLEFVGNASRAEYGSFFDGGLFPKYALESWMVNYPGYGQSTGEATLENNYIAAEIALHEVKQAAQGRPIFFAGNSIGTTAALYLAARYPSAGVLLKNPPPLQQLVLGRFGWWNAWLIAAPIAWWLPSQLNSVQNAKKCAAPAMIISAEADNVVPIRYQKMIVDAYAGPKTWHTMPQYGHNDGLTKEAVVQLENFFSSVS